MTKQDYRDLACRKRDDLSVNYRKNASIAISKKLYDYIEEKKYDNVLIYYSYRSEVETRNLIFRLIEDKINVFCPKITDSSRHIMEFFTVRKEDDIGEGFRGIPEPLTNEMYSEKTPGKTLVVLPGVAFDINGNRIGYRGGYYDRYLSAKKELDLLAIAFDEQIFDDGFPMMEYDIPVNKIITQSRFYSVGGTKY